MIRNIYASLLVLLIVPAQLHAQRAFGGQPYGNKAAKRGMPPAVAVHLPEVDVPALLAEDATRAAQGLKGPYRFGFTHHTDYDLANSGSWVIMPNGDRVWRLMLHCPDAVAINLVLGDFVVPEGARLFLYNPAGEVRGAYTAQSNPGHHTLGTTPLNGDHLTVEYIEPPAVSGQGRITISEVIHDYRDLGKSGADREFGASGPCNVNTICPEGDDWRDEIRSVAHVIIGNGVCSGTLLNNCAQDSTPYFLTAHHCTDDNDNYGSYVFIFNWESPVCDPTEDAPMDHSISGCDLLVQNGATDVSFLLLSSTPPEDYTPYFAGWDKSGTPPDSVTCIHHPSGDIKKISHAWGTFDQQNVDLGNGAADCWHIPEWGVGTTEPGSSGSGLWDQDHHIIGQLYGGSAECGNSVDDFFGRFDLSFPLLEQWLGTCADTLEGYDPYAIIPVPQDAGITSIMDVDVNTCNVDSIRPTVTLKNNGEEDLLTVLVSYQIDGILAGSLPWTGILHPLQTANVQLPWLHFTGGEHELRVLTTLPNGQVDDDITNDMDSIRFVVSNPGETTQLDLQLDQYGSETTWQLTTLSGLLLYSGGPYEDNEDGGDLITREFCLAHTCYLFSIQDAVGDGICCDYGEGSYSISDPSGAFYLERSGDYGEGRTDVFCASPVGIEEHAAIDKPLVMPNPSTGRFRLQLPSAAGRLTVMDALGRPVWQRSSTDPRTDLMIDLGDVAAGTYLLLVEVDGVRSAQRIVVQR